MCVESPQILLVGKGFTPGSQFLGRLCHNGCACLTARNLAEARAALQAHEFELVLSEMTLSDGSATPLLELLENSFTTLYFCVAVYDGCWWLPALERGRRTWGQAALRPADFAHELVTLLGEEIFSGSAPAPVADVAAASANIDDPKVIPMPPAEIPRPNPQRVEPVKAKAQKSSA